MGAGPGARVCSLSWAVRVPLLLCLFSHFPPHPAVQAVGPGWGLVFPPDWALQGKLEGQGGPGA